MKKFLKYAALIATVLVVSSSAWAWSPDFHVSQAPNNKGDVLLFPWFIASDGGWESKITVINTDLSNSVVAKLVIRSSKNSQELKDFLLYLSPADVWTGKVYYDGSVIKIYSDDDSVVTPETGGNTPVFATAAAPVNEPLEKVKCTDDFPFFGYVEVILAAYGPLPNAAGAIGPGVTKYTIYNKYYSDPAGDESKISLPLVFPLSTTVVKDVYGEILKETFNPGINPLAGYIQIADSVSNLGVTYRATALKDYKNLGKLLPSLETKLGVNCINSMAEIEAALSKDFIAMPTKSPKGTSVHLFTFPTKQTNFKDCAKLTNESPFFNGRNAIPFAEKDFNLIEGSRTAVFSPGVAEFLCEVNYLVPSSFAEGWSRYEFDNGTTYGNTLGHYSFFTDADDADYRRQHYNLSFEGAPVLATFLYLSATGLSGDYGAWTDTEVDYYLRYRGDGYNDFDRKGIKIPLCDYQYTQDSVCSFLVNGKPLDPDSDSGSFRPFVDECCGN